MTKKVLRTQDGKKVVVDYSTDTKLYSAPVNPPNTGTTFTRGTDLLAHKARSGNIYFYTYSWSLWQSEQEEYQLISKKEAEDFLLDKLSKAYPEEMYEHEIETAREFGFDLLEETA